MPERRQGGGGGSVVTAKADERDYTVRAVERVCSILNLLQESVEGVSLIEVAHETDLPKSSAFRYLWTLEGHRYVERDGDSGLYRLGLGFVGMQSRHLEVLRERARPWLEKLRNEFGETVNLAILDGDHVIYVDVVESRHRVRFASARGSREPLDGTAIGKAIASRLTDDRVRELMAQADRHTAPKSDRVEHYLADLQTPRRLGYAISEDTADTDSRCVAAPLSGARIPVAIGISAPSARFTTSDAEKAALRLIEVTREIATNPIPEQRTATRTDP